LVAISLTLFASASFAADPPRPKPKVPEFVEMLGAILINGSKMSPTSGWFHVSESRYSWNWLAGRFDLNKDGLITVEDLKGSAPLFRALDRDGDEAVTSEDLDWSPRSPYLQGRAQSRGRFARMDQNGNGRVTLEEWEKSFEQATKGKKFLTQDDLADLLYPAARLADGIERSRGRRGRPAEIQFSAGRSGHAVPRFARNEHAGRRHR
jgi:Ca2+-binding EF-hand superfamily protein